MKIFIAPTAQIISRLSTAIVNIVQPGETAVRTTETMTLDQDQ